jgi:hypothetical protein
MSRAKDSKIIKESQKIFKIIKTAFIIVAIMSFGAVGTVTIYKATKDDEKKVLVPREGEKTVTLIIRPGEEISYQIPPKHFFRIYSKENVVATTWDGRKIRDVAWLGDEIRHANFKLKSEEEHKDAVVIITLRQK